MQSVKIHIKAAKLLVSERGGISYLAFEVIITVIILSLLTIVIYLFRNNMDIISSSAEKVEAVDKLNAEAIIPIDKDIVTGSEVVSVIRYYDNDPAVSIEVNIDGQVTAFTSNKTSLLGTVNINYEDRFSGSFIYAEAVPGNPGAKKLSKIIYIKE